MTEHIISNPSDAWRRSPIYRYHQSRKACFVGRSGGLWVDSYPEDKERGVDQARSLAFFDLTAVSRLGFKGADTLSWLSEQHIPTPDKPNQACLDEEGSTVMRLSNSEFLILDSIIGEGTNLPKLRSNWSMNIRQRTYLLECGDSHGCFALTGSLVPLVLSKVCGLDMRLHKFAPFCVARTSIARASSIVTRVDHGITPCFLILADLSICEYMWEGFIDAMQEFSGQAMGISTLKHLM